MQITMGAQDSILGGSVAPLQLGIPSGAVSDTNVAAAAAIQTTKLLHQYLKHYSQAAVNVAAERKVVHVVRGTGGEQLAEALVGAVTAPIGAATFVIDIQANGVSLLSAGPVTIGTSQIASNYATYSLTLAAGAASIAQGQAVEVVISSPTAGGGTLAQEVFAQLKFRGPAQ